MKDRSVRYIKYAGCILFLFFVLLIAYNNRQIILNPLMDYIYGNATFEEAKDSIQKNLVGNNTYRKSSFVNLNGAYARLTGRTRYNKAQLLNNGMLFYADLGEPKVELLAETIEKISEYANQQDIGYLFVSAPFKLPMEGQLVSEGAEILGHLSNDYMNSLLEMIQSKGIYSLDLREYLSKNIEQVNKNFYRTDHHWNTDGAFQGYQIIMNKIHQMNPDIEGKYDKLEYWNRHELPNWWLGSFGKKVGRLFAGLDSLIYYLPRFETNMSFLIPSNETFRNGAFDETVLISRFIEEKNLFENNAYAVYIGGDYPITFHRNQEAPNKKRLLLIKDSFTLPIEAFLSTEFSEIDVIDPRHYNQSGILEYISWTKPDFILEMLNPSTLSNDSYLEVGPACENLQEGEVISLYSDILISESSVTNNCYEITSLIQPNHIYKITAEKANCIEGNADNLRFALYNLEKNKKVDSIIFDMDYCNNCGGYEWFFHVPEDEGTYRLEIYLEPVQGSGKAEISLTNVSVLVLD